jgi:hypothetical protein
MLWPESLARAAVDRWERSRAFHLKEVDRAVRLAFDARHFPAAWSAGGYDEREAIIAAGIALERAGLAIVRRSGRGALATERAVVLQPAAVEQAYSALATRGVVTRRDVARRLQREAYRVARDTDGWLRIFLEAAASDLTMGRFNRLGRSAHLQRHEREVRHSLRVLPRLVTRDPFDERSLSGEVFGETKRLRELRPRIRQMLLTADPHWQGKPAPTERGFWEHYGESFRQPFTAVASAANLRGVADLRLFRPYAELPRPILDRLADLLSQSNSRPVVTTIENLSAFLRYIEEPDVRLAIEAEQEIVLYTAGFASDDLTAFLAGAAPYTAEVRHWGDTDVHGLRIAQLLGRSAGRVQLFRATAEWVRLRPPRLGTPLDAMHRRALERIICNNEAPNCEGADDLAGAVLESGYWFEQEVYYADDAVVALSELHEGFGMAGNRRQRGQQRSNI